MRTGIDASGPSSHPSNKLFDCVIEMLRKGLERVVSDGQASLLAESAGQFFDFDERKDSEKQVLTCVMNVY